jgi:hypothetical protein
VVAIQTFFVKVLAVTPNEQENTEVTTKGIRLQGKSIHTHFGQTVHVIRTGQLSIPCLWECHFPCT